MRTDRCCILNGGGGAWAFEGLARQLSATLSLDVSETPREFNYLLSTDDLDALADRELFIPLQAIRLAADKRLLAKVFLQGSVPIPQTRLAESADEVDRILAASPEGEWCLKFPTGCGASGHRLLRPGESLLVSWPRPYVVQEFVRLECPEVYRIYGAAGDLFGWVVRRFPSGSRPSPWVAHARGARYEAGGPAPRDALVAARAALAAIDLLDSFGCVDLLRKVSGEWVVLEVGTDGLFNHVDRDLGLPELEREIQRRIADSFWKRVGGRT
jgi:glutathione synthase/RimK-type ligase-like ATP-grasp enzyme